MVLVTGASRGLGLEFVRQYATAGWRVLACARTPSNALLLNELVQAFPHLITVYALNVDDFRGIDALAHQLAGTSIDVLLNVAGILDRQGFGTSNYDAWTAAFRTNVLAPMKMAEAFVDHVAASQQKKIVTLTSTLGSIGGNESGGLYSYRSTKAAANALMKSMAIDLSARGIIAAPLHPGWVRTDMGGLSASIDAKTSVSGMVRVIAGLSKAQAGKFYSYESKEIPW